MYSVSTDTHFSHKAWHDTSAAIGKINYSMVGDQSGTITNNFDVHAPGVGLADRGTFLVDPDGMIQFMEITAEASAVTPPNCCARSRPRNTSLRTPAKSARPSGKKGEKTLAPSLDLVGKI